MSFSETRILRGIFSSSSLFSQMSKLPLNLPAQFIMLEPFSQGLVISRLISLKLSPLQASALIPSSPFIQSHLPSLPSSDPSASQPMLITSKLIVFTFSTLHNFFAFFFFSLSPLFPLFTFILAFLSSPRRKFVHYFHLHTRVSYTCQKPILYQVRSIHHMSMSKFSSSSLRNIKITTTTMKNKINATLFYSLQLHPSLMCSHRL